MKRCIRALVLASLLAALLCTAAWADSGPKPQLTVRVKNAPEEGYYLDLLAQGDWEDSDDFYDGLEWSYSDEERAALDDGLLSALRDAIPEGWHACTAQGSHGAPMWGDLVGEDTGVQGLRLHTFRYVGVPETYRILMVTVGGDVWVSDPCTRHTLQSAVTVDWAARKVSVPPVWVSYGLQFIGMLLPTLLLEGVLLFAFGYRQRKSWRSFLLVNLITQGAFAGYLAAVVLNHGVGAWSLLLYVPVEFIITLTEVVLYRRLLTERSAARAVGYAVTANLCSAVVGLQLVSPLWRWIATLA